MSAWFASPEFLDVWKAAFQDAGAGFADYSEAVSASSKRERTGGLWTQIQQPYLGVHLLAIELQPDISPLAIQLKVWVNEDSHHLYSMLHSANPPELLGHRTVLSAHQKPRPSWESQLRKRGISLVGLRYTMTDLSFLQNETQAVGELRRMGAEFIAWLIANLTAGRSPEQICQPLVSPVSEAPNALENHEIIYPDDLQEQDLYAEGAAKTVTVNAYDRNPESRRRCIEHYGPKCVVCELEFDSKYGKLGRGFIHVHHEIPLSLVKQAYLVDPIRDLKPVCPNCHAMLHRVSPPLSIEELKACLKRA